MFSSFMWTSLDPKYYATFTGIAGLFSILFLLFEWWFFRRHGTSSIEMFAFKFYSFHKYIHSSLVYLLFYPFQYVLSSLRTGTVPTESSEKDDQLTSTNSSSPSSPSPDSNGTKFSTIKSVSMECKVWRNSLSLFRGCEYAKYQQMTGRMPLTYYDMNLSSQDHQTFFTCQNDVDQPEYGMMQSAWRERDSLARIAGAHRALHANKYCAVALILLSEEQADTVERVEKLLRLTLKVAENNYQRTALALKAADINENNFGPENHNGNVVASNHKTNNNSNNHHHHHNHNHHNHHHHNHHPHHNHNQQNHTNNGINGNTCNFIFHDIDDELNRMLKELRAEIEPTCCVSGNEKNQQTQSSRHQDHHHSVPVNSKQQDLKEKNKVPTNPDKINLAITNIINTFSKTVPNSTNHLLVEELKRDLNVIIYIKRRMAMCLRKLGRLKEAAKMYKDLTKEFPLVNALNIHENLIEIYLEMGAYADVQAVLTKYDDINLPKSAVICYTAALLKARNCADKYVNVQPPQLSYNCLSYNYFDQVNYFQNPHIHIANLNASANAKQNIPIPGILSNQTNSQVALRNELNALEAIYRAVEFNPHVPLYLLELKSMVPPPEHVLRRGDSEALAYAFFHLKHWKNVPGALNLLESTWKRTFQMIPSPLEKGHLFYPYQTSTETTDRQLLPTFHQVSVYPKKVISSATLLTIFFTLLSLILAILTHFFPEEMLGTSTMVNNNPS